MLTREGLNYTCIYDMYSVTQIQLIFLMSRKSPYACFMDNFHLISTPQLLKTAAVA